MADIYGDDNPNQLDGTQDGDFIFGFGGNDTLRGHDGDDWLFGGEGNDSVDGGAGNDVVIGGAGKDTLAGGDGNDALFGGEGNDVLFGGAGNDALFGGAGDDGFELGAGNDYMYGGDGNDRTISGEGNDTLIGGAGDDELADNAGGNNFIHGGDGNDHLGGHRGNSTLYGGNGDDTVSISWGSYVIDGGDGVDTLQFMGSVTVDLGAGTLVGTSIFPDGPATATLAGIENYFHEALGAAHITGSSDDNELRGGQENDTIIGGLGNDTLLGMPGNDWYVFNVAPGEANADHFGVDRNDEGVDKVVLDGSAMPELGAAGQLGDDDERWYATAGATGGAEEDDRLVYDTEAGKLYYDADGSGAGAAQLIANVRVFDENFEFGPLRASDVIII